jgi:hypothetical protein
MPEPFILSPLEFPFAWGIFAIKWGGTVLCVLFAFRLWRATAARWWLLIGAAFLLSLVTFLVRCAMFGSLPLPQGLASPTESLPPPNEHSAVFRKTVQVSYDLDLVAPVVAMALGWAYRVTKPITEPAAPPEGGPATQCGNAGVTEGPPSVS